MGAHVVVPRLPGRDNAALRQAASGLPTSPVACLVHPPTKPPRFCLRIRHDYIMVTSGGLGRLPPAVRHTRVHCLRLLRVE